MSISAGTIIKGIQIWRAVKPFKRWKERRQRKKRLKELGIEEGSALRTSTGAGLAGVLANLLVQVLQMFPATEGLATPEVAAGATAVVMWIVARIWKTPEKPGAV